MPRPRVDPQFPARLRTIRQQRHLSLRACADLANYSHTYLWEIEAGRKRPTIDVAAQLDKALAANGALAGLVTMVPSPINPDDQHRLAAAARNPRQLDPAALDALAVTLAQQRRLEDAIGAAMLIDSASSQAAVVERLARDGPHGLRHRTFQVAAQWAQFAGWLHAATGDHDQANAWYLRAMAWATEIVDADMMATALSMRGHLAWLRGEYPAMLKLSQAALWVPAGPAVRAVARQQEARAYACLGDADTCDARLVEAEQLAHQVFDQPEQLPPWLYFFDPGMFILQRGLANHLLGRHTQAVDLLTTGLERLPVATRRSEWIGSYLAHLATAHLAAGNHDCAADLLGEVLDTAAATGSARLTDIAEPMVRQLDV